MDMFSLHPKPDSTDNDATLKRHIQEAFPHEASPTTPDTLLERILIQAEAMPQAMPEVAADAQVDAETVADLSPSVAMQQQRATQQTRANGPQRHNRQLRHLNWQLYHQYLERPLHKANVGSGIQL